MRFSISSAFQPVDHLLELARAADELGYHAISMPDHVVDLEELETPYPYTSDGTRRWDLDAEWPDPWVLIGALATVTSRIRFFTSVYVPALRNPFQVAKSVGTAAVLSADRVSLGVGIGWCREEFELLGQDFRTRGRRTDEGLALMKALWEPGWTEFVGEFYTAPRMMMNPSPSAPVPILVGGLSEIAFRRAARHDGWVGDLYTIEEAGRHAGRLAEIRAEVGATGDFSVITALTDAFLPEHFATAEERGVTDVWTMPWSYYHGLDATLAQKIDGLERFAADVIGPMQG
ncbi:MAG: TIGR03619 family F420-dependent LLM class oxidoreductase [Nocardioides sp.]